MVIFLSGIIFIATVVTYFISSGSHQQIIKQIGGVDQTVVIPGTYHESPKHYS